MADRRTSRRRRGRDEPSPAEAGLGSERVARRCDLAEAEVLPEVDRPWRRLLRLDGEDASHVDLRDPTHIEFTYVRRLADLVDACFPERAPIVALHLGGGGFTLPRYVAATRPGSRQEVAEPDGALLDLAREELGLVTGRDLRVRVRDGRDVLEARAPGTCDLLVLDAFVAMEVPGDLADAGAMAAARRALAPGGTFAVNVVDGTGAPRSRRLGALLAEVFEEVAVAASRKVVRGRQGGNVVLVGATAPLPLTRLTSAALRGGAPELVLGDAEARPWLAAGAG